MKPVICTYCNAEIYEYRGPEPGIKLKAEYFKPIAEFAAPTSGSDLRCPRCFVKWVACSNQLGQLRMLVDSAYAGSGNIGKNKGGEE
ncbi:MAG TPA: hypothetical protein VFC63_06280 [Blastocatellia bacterium]|nr:hypothetical protein [Blastocatellia bacterium]